MLIPLEWLENYIKLKHTPVEFGSIMTDLEFMQDGPIKDVNGQKVIDLEVRQNRPDMLSIIGAAREYGAYINEPVLYPNKIDNIDVEWGKPDKNLNVESVDIVKRFITVEIEGIKVGKSPKWITDALKAYGISAINNIVDITNFVMLEYGMPLHAFDAGKLDRSKGKSLLTLRRAVEGEEFKTWQNTKLTLTNNDCVVADNIKPVAIAGIIGGANSDIDLKTKRIILEAACYEHSYIRRSSLRHSIRTDASTRHEKILNPENARTAVLRALYLIKELVGGEVLKIEDYYPNPEKLSQIDFDIYQVERLGGLQLEPQDIIDLLLRLGFEIIEHKDALGINKNIFTVSVPKWRTDIVYEEDLVEEVLRLYGYSNIPMLPLNSAPPDLATPKDILLEEKIRDILINLSLDEHVTVPLVKFAGKFQQIQLENPLNKERNGLRVSISDTLADVAVNYKKTGIESFGIFEIGKIYEQKKIGKYCETKMADAYYYGYGFEKIKGDLLNVFTKLGLVNTQWVKKKDSLYYYIDKVLIAKLNINGYSLYIENISKFTDIQKIPYQLMSTKISQKITEEISFIMDHNFETGQISDLIYQSSEYVSLVYVKDIYKGDRVGGDKKSVTFTVLFEDEMNKLTQSEVEKIKSKFTGQIENKFNISMRDF